jgi:hypothetical protein
MKLVQLGKQIKNQSVEAVINIFVNIKIKTVKEFQSQDANFVLSIIYRMRSRTFRRNRRKMSRRRRGGQETPRIGRSNTAELNAMELGYAPTAPPIEQMNMLGRSNTAELNAMELGYAPTAPPIEQMNMLGRSNTSDLNAMEEGYANPQVAIDIESTPDIEMGTGGRKRRRTRKARKSRKGGKRRKSHRR